MLLFDELRELLGMEPIPFLYFLFGFARGKDHNKALGT
jgi:hypothetical protein